MKKNLTTFLIILVVLTILGVGGFFIFKSKKPAEEEPVTPESEGVLIKTTLEERPFVTLTPRTDGRELTLEISRVKNAQTIEYELVYLSAGLSRGVIGSIDLDGEAAVERKLLLGTCSRDVCKYDEDVTEGTLTLRFRGSDGVRKFIADFHLQQGDKILTSIDNNFQLEGTISPTTFYLTMPTVGLPREIEGQPVSEIYGVFTAGSKTIKSGIVNLALIEENPDVALYSWDGRAWQVEEEDFKTDGKTLSASVGQLAAFMAIATTKTPTE
ncbi:MAG TPA: hypothetical protein VMX76_00585 [Nevskiaceae bacterium]|nr:hypothetical protein [Nevskiaceae bacterium]